MGHPALDVSNLRALRDALGGPRLVSGIGEIAVGIFEYTMFLVVLHVPPVSSFK